MTGPVAARWHIVRLLPHGGRVLVGGLVLVNVALGVLPVLFIVATSVVIGTVPATAADGPGSAAWSSFVTAFLVAAGAFGAQQILAEIQPALGHLLARRVDGRFSAGVMATALASPGVQPLENQDRLDELGEALRELEQAAMTPGRAAAGLLALIARYLQLTGLVAVVGVRFSWPAAAGLAAVALLFRRGQRGGLRRYSAVFGEVAADHRKVGYLRRLATHSAAAMEIRVFGLAGWLSERYRTAYLAWLEPIWARRRLVYLRAFRWLIGVGFLLIAAVFATLGAAAAAGEVSLTDLALVAQAAVAAVRLGDFYPESDVQTQFGMNADQAVRAFRRGVRDDAGPGPAPAAVPVPAFADITFADVSFRYPGGDRPVLDRLSLTLPAAKRTAIVGLNGTGKTTLVKLLAGLHEPTGGSVLVDGTDLRSLPLAAWRRRLAVVFQDYLRYELTIAENVGFGSVEHAGDRAGIRRAADAAGLGEVIDRLPTGIDTPLTRHVAGGVELSGGQWQRVALARALFAVAHGASVLVLDEPTASQDIRAEARFVDDVLSLVTGVTIVLVSHRFATVRHADVIAVVADGRVVEHGSHEALLRRDGRYAELFRLQAARFAVGERA